MADERKYYVFCADNCKFEGMTKEQILTAITQAVEEGNIRDVDTGFITKIVEQNKQKPLSLWVGSPAEYNALKNKSDDCFYIINNPINRYENLELEINENSQYYEIPSAAAVYNHTEEKTNAVATELQKTINTVASNANKETNAAAAELQEAIDTVASDTQTKLNKKADIDANGLILTSQLPSFVDDVLEYATKSKFPTTGEAGKIYIDLSNNKTYRWGGSAYAEISPSIALGETSSTAYRGDRGAIAYNHSQSPHDYAASNHTHGEATQTAKGFMSATDKKKLDGIPSDTQTQLNNKAAGSHTHGAATTVANGFMSASDKTKLDGIPSDTQTQLNNKANLDLLWSNPNPTVEFTGQTISIPNLVHYEKFLIMLRVYAPDECAIHSVIGQRYNRVDVPDYYNGELRVFTRYIQIIDTNISISDATLNGNGANIFLSPVALYGIK